ncbi:hypothetical protein JTB14_008093 [Gonioctena quinquepunctata]|nr:hypothetical protein JTB14_008093 [Gonioctena quinquepunctata]
MFFPCSFTIQENTQKLNAMRDVHIAPDRNQRTNDVRERDLQTYYYNSRSVFMAQFSQKIKALFKRRSVKYGLPFFVLMVGGSFGLKEFTQLRYQFSRISIVRPDELKKYGIEMKKAGEVTIETEFEKVKDLDTEHWEQVRGPRPWEDKIES